MASAFNLTAQINLRGPANARQIAANIRKQLGSISANVNVNINPKSVRTVAQLNKSLTTLNSTLKQVTPTINKVSAAVNKLQTASSKVNAGQVSSQINSLNSSAKGLVTTLPQVSRQFAVGSDNIKNFGRQAGLAVRRFSAFAATTSVIYGVSNAISRSLQEFIAFDKQIVRLSQVTGKTQKELAGFGQTITQLSTSLGASSLELSQISVTLAQAGLQAKEAEQALKALALTTLAPSFSNINQTVEGSIALLKQFEIGTGQLEAALGSINSVAANFAVEAGDIIKAIQRTGGVFATASKGVSEGIGALQEFIAVFTSVRATTRESAETIATGLRTIFTRIQRGSTIEALKEFGVTLTDAEGKFVGAYRAIGLLAEGLRSIDPRDVRFSQIVEELGGFRQIGKVIPLIQQFTTAQNALNVAQQGTGSLSADAAKGQLALAVQIQKVREEFNAFIRSVGQSSAFKNLVTVGLDLASALIKIADATKGLLPLIGIFAAFRGIRAATQFSGGLAEGLSGKGKANGGFIRKYARGGVVPGTGNTDSVPAMLQPGEFVIRKKAVQTLGTQRLHNMNKFGNGGKQRAPAESPTTLPATGGTEFTHLSLSKVAQTAKGQNVRLYNNMGLDLPKSWNRNWGLADGRVIDNRGAYASDLANYIRAKDVFKTLKSGQSKYRFVDRQRGVKGPQDILRGKGNSIKGTLATLVETQAGSFLDNDFQVGQVLPRLVRQAISSTEGMTQKDSRSLRAGMRQTSAMKLDGDKGRRKTTKSFRQQMGLYAQGGSVDTVPAMLTPGEFVINKNSASRIGGSTLNKLNNADRIKGYNRGGWVGFASGGGVSSNPALAGLGDAQALNLLSISSSTNAVLTSVGETLEKLGITASNSSRALGDARDTSAASAQRALEADYELARAGGASADVLLALRGEIDKNAAVQQEEIQIRRAIQEQGIGGEQIQAMLNEVEKSFASTMDNIKSQLMASGMSEDDANTEVANRATGERARLLGDAASAEGLDLSGVPGKADHLERTINSLMRDTDVLSQMNARYREDRRKELMASGENAAKIEQIIDKEITARKNAANDQANAEGVRGPKDRQRQGMSGLMLGGLVIGAGSAASNFLDPKASAVQAGAQAGLQSGTQSFGIGIGIISELKQLEDSVQDVSGKLGVAARFGAKFTKSLAIAGTGLFTLFTVTQSVFNAMQEFEENLLTDKIKMGVDAVSDEFDRFKDDLDKIDIAKLNAALVSATQSFERSITDIALKGRITFTNFFEYIQTLIGMRSEEEFGQISEIERLGGKDAAVRARQNDLNLGVEFGRIIPQLAAEQAAAARALSDSILQTLELRLKRGETAKDITSGLDFDAFAETIATADTATRQWILNLENSGLDQATINRRRQEIITAYAEEQVRLKELQIAREKELQSAIRFAKVFTSSLQRSLNNFNQAVNATALFLDGLDRSVQLVTEAYKGQSKVLKTTIEAITVLENPQAFSATETGNAASQAAGFFGASPVLGNLIQPLLQSGSLIEDTIMSTINDVLTSNAESSNELIEAKISTNIIGALKGLGLPPELVQNLGAQVGRAITKLRGTPGSNDQISFAELQDEVAGLSQTLGFAKSVQSAAVSALQTFNKALNTYENNVNNIIDAQLSSNNKLRAAENILIDASASLAKALGKTTSLEQARQRLQSRISKFNTDQSTPRGLFNEIKRLGDVIIRNDSVRQGAAARGPAGADDFQEFTNNVKNSSIALRENYQALEFLAENTDMASEAMNTIQNQQRRIGGRVSFIEKLVTSSPDELLELNQAFGRLQNNINGQTNDINNSVGAQRAYKEALLNGANAFGAMKAAQAAFAQERKSTLGLLQDLLPFLGEGQEASGIRANVLESMLLESGIGINPLLQQVLNSLRNPENDPALAAAVSFYNEATSLQAEANKYLARLDGELATDIATKNAVAISEALKNIELRFVNQELKDLAAGINKIIGLEGGGEAGAFARGGIIYASTGQEVFKPKGTDTVPAMLTPGEFVVNRQATQRNRGMLESINSGKVSYYDRGGLVHSFGDTKQITKSNRVSANKLIDLDALGDKLLRDATVGELYLSPQAYTFIQPAANTSPAPATIPPEIDFRKDLDPGAGAKILPGIASPFVNNGGTINYIEDANYKNGMNDSGPVKDFTSFIHLNSEAIPEKFVRELDFEAYKNKANSHAWDLPEWSYAGINFNQAPTMADIRRLHEKDFYSSTMIADPMGLVKNSSGNPYPQNFQNIQADGFRYEIYDGDNGKDVVSKGPPAYPMGHPYAGVTWTKRKASPEWNKVLKEDLGDDTFIKAQNFAGLKGNKDMAWAAYQQTSAFLQAPNFKDGDTPQEVIDLQAKLKQIYDGAFVKDFMPPILSTYFDKIKDITGIDNPRSLLVFNNLPNTTTALDDAIKYYEANPEQADRDNVAFTGRNLRQGSDFVKDKDLKIYGMDDTGNIDPNFPVRNFPALVNGNLDVFDEATKTKIMDELAAQHPGGVTMDDLPIDELEIPIPGVFKRQLQRMLGGAPIPKMKMKIAYQKWKGKFFNPDTDKFEGLEQELFLPNKVGKTLFSELDTDMKRLVKGPAGEKFKAPDIFQAVKGAAVGLGLNNAGINKFLEGAIAGDFTSDPAVAQAHTKIKDTLIANLGQSYFKNIANQHFGVDTLVKQPMGGAVDVNMGEHFIDAITEVLAGLAAAGDGIGDKALDEKRARVGDGDLPNVIKATIAGAIDTLGGVNLPGLGSGWLARNIGALPALLNNRPDMAIGAALKSGNVLGNLSGYLTKIGNSANSPQAYQFMKEVYTLAAGASSVLTGLGSGNTNFIAQIMDAGLNTNWNTLFRSAGASFLTDRLLSTALPGDLQNLLADELDGGKIRRVGANGALTNDEMINALPTDWKGFSDLVLNPYNEFPETDTRAKLIEKLGIGLVNSKGPFGLPYFDPNTSQFIFDRLSALYDWYGGNAAVGWPGQDSLFDKIAEPDPQKRATNFFGAIGANPQFYTGSNQAHIELGLGGKYGPLPKEGYFQGRAAQGLQTGGVVYAQDGGEGQMVNFRPQGTDTVPAMLTPGEFVINRSAAQKNLPLLQAINNGSKGYSRGGVIYANEGAYIGGEYFDNFQQYKASRPGMNPRGLVSGWGNAIRQAEIDRVNEFYKVIGPAYLETESLLTGQYGDSPFGKKPGLEGLLGEALQAGDMEKAQKIGKALQLSQSVLPAIKAARDHTYFLVGEDGKYGTMDDGDSPLGDLSTALTVLGTTPGFGIIPDLASVLVDLARGDTVGAGLGMVAATPFFGIPAGFAKAGRMMGFGPEGIKIAKKLGSTGVHRDITQELTRRVTLRQTSKIKDEKEAAKALMLKLNKGAVPNPVTGNLDALSMRVANGGMPIEEYNDIKRAMFDSNLSGLEPEWDKLKPLMYPKDESVRFPKGAPGPLKKFAKGTLWTAAGIAALLGAWKAYQHFFEDLPAQDEGVVPPPGGDLNSLFGARGAIDNPITGIKENIPPRPGTVQFEDGDANRPLPVIPGDVDGAKWLEETAGDADQRALNERARNGLKQYKREFPGDNYLSEIENRVSKGTATKEDIETIQQNLIREGKTPAFARGGMVYADQGMLIPYRPQGTDTVPAMLTPGEFVINRKATQANLPLLKAINSGAMSTGGVVYAQDGKEITDKDRFFTQLADKQSLPTTHSMSSMESTNTPSPRSGEVFNNEAVLKELDKMSAFVSTLLGIGGMIPYAGEPLDLLAAGIDTLRGDYTSASLGLASMAPVAGMTTGAANITRKLSNLIGDTVPDLIAAATKKRDEALITINSLSNKTEIPGKGRDAFRNLEIKNRRPNLRKPGEAKLSGQEMNLKKAEMIAEAATPPKTLDEFLDKSEKGVTATFEQFGTRAQTKAYLEELGTSPDRLFLDGQNLDITKQGGLANLYNSGRAMKGQGPLRPGEFDEKMLPRFDKFSTDNTENVLKIKQAQQELTDANKNLKALEAISTGIEPKAIKEAIPAVPKGPPPLPPMTADEAWKNTQRAQGKSMGGVVYASNGMLIPGSGVNYLAAGGQPTPLEEQRKQRKKQFETKRFLLRTGLADPFGMQALKEIVTAPGTFDLLNPNAIDESADYVEKKNARIQAEVDALTTDEEKKELLLEKADKMTQRANYLAKIGTNSERLVNRNGNKLDKVIPEIIDPSNKSDGKSILEILTTQFQNAKTEYDNIKSLSDIFRIVYAKFDPSNRQNQAGGGAGNFARGGVVYASNGLLVPYRPQGTDTVPAMLTPGEFVVNKSATDKNLPALQQMNRGGRVSYLADGTPGTDALKESVTKLTSIFDSSATNIQQSMNKIAQILTQFAQNIPVLTGNNNNGVSNNNDTNPMVTIEALGNQLDTFVKKIAEAIPDKVVVEGRHDVNVVINGAQALQQLLNGPLAEIVRKQVEAGFAARDREREGS